MQRMTTQRNTQNEQRPATYAQWLDRYGDWYADDSTRAAEYSNYLDAHAITQSVLRA